jgi:hemoglobin-like flavoprotein
MTPTQISLVQQSFAMIGNDGQDVARIFYARLFEIDPSTKPLFPTDLKAQGIKLMAVLRMVVTSLDRLGPLIPTIENLARRHVDYGVSERQYPSVGSALIWTLDTVLGDRFTSDTRAAWVEAYGILSTTMIAAARTAVPADPAPASANARATV